MAEALENPSGYLASLDYRKADSPLNLHLHWHVVNTSVPATMFIDQMDLTRLWEKALSTPIADSQALVLCPEHALSASANTPCGGTFFDRLVLICDLFFFLKARGEVLDWDLFLAECQRFHLSRWVYFSLAILQAYSACYP